MSTLAKSVSFDASMMWVDMADGRKLGVPLAYFPRLLAASPEALVNYEISGGGSGLHWDELDEDISVEGLLAGGGDLTQVRRFAA
ncbi:MAG: DUF2442 domain-containing protein [Sulfuricella sp.]|nr:DUF2442 domain-containing protein [Sulfuricella sp.]